MRRPGAIPSNSGLPPSPSDRAQRRAPTRCGEANRCASHGAEDREQQARVHRRAAHAGHQPVEPRQHRAGADLGGAHRLGQAEVARDHEVRERERDEVEHDRDDDLVRAEARLEPARASAPQSAPPANAAASASGSSSERRQPRAQRSPTSAHANAPTTDLALGADVEEPGPKAERDREPGEDERRRLEEHLAQAVAAEPRSRRAAA